MISCGNIPELPSYGSAACYCNYPGAAQIAAGVVPLDSLPAEWWNAMWACNNNSFNCARSAINTLVDEICNAITCSGITISPSCNSQLYQAIKQYGTADQAGAVKSSTAAGKVSIDTNGIMSLNCYGSAALQTTAQNLTGAINELKDRIDNFVGVVYSDTTPLVDGTATAGTAACAARGDHVHPIGNCICSSCGNYIHAANEYNELDTECFNCIHTCGWYGSNWLLTTGECGYNILCSCGCYGRNTIYAEGVHGYNQICATGCCGYNQICATGCYGYNTLMACFANYITAAGSSSSNQMFANGTCSKNCILAQGCKSYNCMWANGVNGYNALTATCSGGYNILEANTLNQISSAGQNYFDAACTDISSTQCTYISTVGNDCSAVCTEMKTFASPGLGHIACTNMIARGYVSQVNIQAEGNAATHCTSVHGGFEATSCVEAYSTCCPGEIPYTAQHTIRVGSAYSNNAKYPAIVLCTYREDSDKCPIATSRLRLFSRGDASDFCSCGGTGVMEYTGSRTCFDVGRPYNSDTMYSSNVFQVELDRHASCYSSSSSYSTPPHACFNHGVLGASAFRLGCVSCKWCCININTWHLYISRDTDPQLGCGGNTSCLYIFTEWGMWPLPGYSWVDTGICCASSSEPHAEGCFKGLIVYG